jgi:drug/metabolite transporter (DMT)-like permease
MVRGVANRGVAMRTSKTSAVPVCTATAGAAPNGKVRANGQNQVMTAPWLMLAAAFLFATMGVCVKFASAQYTAGEIVFYRSLVGAVMIGAMVWTRGGTLRTRVPAMHFWRSISGVSSLSLWFYAIGGLPLATAMTLNYMSSVWMALFLIGGAVMLGSSKVDGRLVATVLTGFAGVALVLRPTIGEDQLWYGLAGLLSGMLAALAYLQVTTLGRAGEPEYRVVFYFSLGGLVVGAAFMLYTGMQAHTAVGLLLLLAIGLLATTAQIMMTRAYAIGRTLSNASLQYVGIAFAFVYGVLLFNDPVTWYAIAGMTLIVIAGLAATLLRTVQAPKDSTFNPHDT